MAKLRVLVLTPDFPPQRGGIQTLAFELARHMTSFDRLVVTLDSDGARALDAAQPFPIARVGLLPGRRRNSIIRLNVAAVRHARALRPDVVISMHTNSAPAARAARLLFGAPTLQYLHAEELPRRPALARWALRSAALNVAVSRHTRDLAVELGADPGRVHVVAPGVDLPPATGRDGRAERPTVLTVSRLDDAYKGHDVIARALVEVRAHVPSVEWVVVGDGALRSDLERLVAELGLSDHVRFEGSVDDAERDAWFGRAHVFAMPSRVPPDRIGGEGFGIAYLEAAAHALPVVAGRAGGAVDAVADGLTGILVDPSDHEAVAAALTELLSDGSRAEALGRAGAERAREYSWPAVAERVEDLCRRAIAERRAAR